MSLRARSPYEVRTARGSLHIWGCLAVLGAENFRDKRYGAYADERVANGTWA
jgi:hypothetical protein